ncbi:unnamed protein product [Citrullus colocynthis]|uniref:Neprosin PEP catalytic domain-containing protein n=1 Tax=Citrullus colocynthis TaxID=252529 RepID=A0ABP0YLW6_9ROSI
MVRPNRSYPKGWVEVPSQAKHNSLISNNIRQPCPVGSVPIRRTLKIDLIRLRSLSSKQATSDVKDISSIGGITFPDDKNVNPGINGDSLPRLVVYWTADGGVKTGCYNMLCQGFVQAHPSVTPHFPLQPSSIYDYEFVIDRELVAFVLTENRTAIGYWPKELFGVVWISRVGSSTQVGWGGIAKPSPNGINPPLGNSHLPNSGEYNEACYFRNINPNSLPLIWVFPLLRSPFLPTSCLRLQFLAGFIFSSLLAVHPQPIINRSLTFSIHLFWGSQLFTCIIEFYRVLISISSFVSGCC